MMKVDIPFNRIFRWNV